MRRRARALVSARAAASLVVSTFHALGVRLLRADSERIGLKQNFSILDADDVLSVLRTPARRPTAHRPGAGNRRSAAGRTRAWPARRPRPPRRTTPNAAQRGSCGVTRRLAAYQTVDFDDLIGLPLQLLARDARRARWQDTLRYLLVDGSRTPTRRSTRCCACSPTRGRASRGRRRRPEHLRLARRDDRTSA